MWLGLLAALVVLTVAGVGLLWLVRYEIRQQVGSSLIAIRDSQVDIVRSWVAERLRGAELAAARPEVRADATHLLATENPTANDPTVVTRLRETLNDLLAGEDTSTWRVADPTGRIVVAAETGTGGQRQLTELLDATSRAIETGTSQFVSPMLMEC